MSNSEISFYVDTLIVETVLGDIRKTAASGMVTDLLTRVKEYVSSHIDQNNKLNSLVNLLAPGVISMGFRALGLGWLGLLFGVVASAAHIDIAGIVSSIWSSLKPALSNDKKVSSDDVDSFVQKSVQENSGNELPITRSYDESLKDAQLLRLAMEAYDKQNLRLTIGITKEAQDIMALLKNKKSQNVSILSRILGWIFKVALGAAGFMVAGDVVNKFLGRPNAIDKTYQEGQENKTTNVSAPMSTQTKFTFKNDSNLPAVLPISNNPESIEATLIQFAKDVYNNLDGKENIIRSSPAFQAVKDDIVWFNSRSVGGSSVFLPKNYTSKKKLVDLFIDDVAQRSQ